MSDKHIDESKTPNRPESSEYGDALTDVLKDQARRNEDRAAAATLKPRTRLHSGLPPVLALISIWLWAFPPSALQPEPPTIPVANQEAGLRMEMFIQLGIKFEVQQARGSLFCFITLLRGSEAESFTRSVVEFVGDTRAVGLGDVSHALTFG